ncbi:putative cu(2+)-exporting ATPase [Rosa chinensis]|uniref:Putative cu(2+)-exporting ATPase n=1 Tax=Rosa chinensis TaxID=74649 RepID=A0A2P6Q6I1_ROSCH|nr:putative cu(2+)-exporting ATPase [Rosa chinensis]
MLTGESLPVFKENELTISAGTINWVEDTQGHEAPIQRLVDSIAGPFVYTIMTLSATTFAFWYYIGTHIFPDVLLNDIAGPDGDSLLLSLKLAVDVLGIRTVLFSGDREEAVATIAKSVGIEKEFIKSSLTPQGKSGAISSLKAAGHHVAMLCQSCCNIEIQV